jgi:8-oxo-dGTP diphosphatase
VDFALLGPVLPTASHPGQPTLGWDGFADLLADAGMPVFALGGMRPGMADMAWTHRAHGLAMMRAWAAPAA